MPLDPAGTPSRAAIQAAIDEAVAAALGDTGWIALTHSGASGTLRYRRRASVVYVEGSVGITLPTGVGTTLLASGQAIPVGYRPSLALNMGIARLNAGDQGGIVTALTDGTISITNATGSGATSVQFRYCYPV